MKSSIKRQIKELSEMINVWDPLGLISMGAPVDEYDCLTHKLFSTLSNKKSNKNIEGLLLKELTEHFGISEKEAVKLKGSISKFVKKVQNWRNHLDGK